MLQFQSQFNSNKQPMDFDAQLAAQLYSLFIPIRLVAAPFGRHAG